MYLLGNQTTTSTDNLGSTVHLYGPKAKVNNLGAVNNMFLGNGASPSSAWSSRSDSTLSTQLRSRLETALQAMTPNISAAAKFCIFPQGANLYPQTVYGSSGYQPGGSGGRQLQENTPLAVTGTVGTSISRVTYSGSTYFTSASSIECLSQSDTQSALNALASEAVSLWWTAIGSKLSAAQIFGLLNTPAQFANAVKTVVATQLKPLVNRSVTASTMNGAQAQDYFRRFQFSV